MNSTAQKAEIITIGDEILVGQTVDTNSAWMGRMLNDIGWEIARITSVADKSEEIVKALDLALTEADVILITGGLGPTKDDITKKTLAQYFNAGWRKDEKVLAHVRAIFERRNLPMLDVNLQQADVPDNCTTLFNEYGTAPGMLFNKDNKIIVSMPGVPYEMMYIMSTHVLPMLAARNEGNHIIKHTYVTTGIGESFLSKKIETLENSLPPEISIAYLPFYNTVRIRFTAKGKDKPYLEAELAKIKLSLYELVGKYIAQDGDVKLEEIVGVHLKENNKTLSTAESCTGGYIAHLITSIPGSSAYFTGSILSYDNKVKINQLGVQEQILKEHGAVSQETVEQMATGALKQIGSDYSIATSGIAGPSGGTPEKPVGTVWIAVASHEKVWSKKFLFNGNRQIIIERTSYTALDMLRKLILNQE